MPYLHVKLGRSITDAQKYALHEKCAALISILPGKNADNCMIQIDAGCDMYMKGAKQPCAFVDLRLFKASPDAQKQEFAAAMCAHLTNEFGISAELIYMNIFELEHWVAGSNVL